MDGPEVKPPPKELGLTNATLLASHNGIRTEASIISPSSSKYKEQAESKGIKPLKAGGWLTVDGAEYQGFGGPTEKIPTNNQQDIVAARLEQVGTYDYNNGTLAVVDSDGRLLIGHGTSENLQALDQSGYRRSSMWVPFSNGEMPLDPTLRRQYSELRERGREKSRQETIQRHLQLYKEIAEKKGIQPIEGGLLMMVDGIEYKHFAAENAKIDLNTDGYNIPIRRIDQVGTYDSNNGRIAFVDGQGRMWVGAATIENFDAIKKAGYKRGGIWVPFSNREMPTERETYERLRDVLTGKPAEQLKAERVARVNEIIEGRKILFQEIAHLPDRDQLYAKVADREATEHINTDELVERKMHARTETDSAGYQRNIYTINGVTFSFRGREELPIYPTLTQSRTQLLGDDPQWISPQDYQTFHAEVNKTQKNEHAPQHYLVSKSILGVIETAIRFGSRDSSLPQLRQELIQGKYSGRALVLLDSLIAANYMDDAGLQVQTRHNNNAEALVLAALLGDPQAQTAVAQKVEALSRHQQQAKLYTERLSSTAEALQPHNLIAVHATKYQPKAGPDGTLIVPTTFDATNGKVLRNTVHTSLNHKVAGHMYGSWGDAGYVIISPFESMIEANGLPNTLNTVDTWWAQDPGEPLRFPHATIIQPGGKEVKGLFEIEGNIVKFKSAGLEQQDLINLVSYLSEQGRLDHFSTMLVSSIMEHLSPYYGSLRSDWDVNAVSTALGKQIFGQEGGWIQGDLSLLRALTNKPPEQTNLTLEQIVTDLLTSSGALTALKPEILDKKVAIDNLVNTLTSSIRSQMFAEINELAAHKAIRSRGFEVQSGGMWAWGNSWTVTSQTAALGEQLGINVAAHSNTPQHELTERFSLNIGAAVEGTGEAARFDWTKYNPKFDELVPRLDPKTRRVLYASGLLTSRD